MNVKKLLLCAFVALSGVTFAQQPFAGCWHPDFIKDWTPAKDVDAKFNRSFTVLQPRFVNNTINASVNQHPEGQVAACLTMHPMCSQVPSQDANNFTGYNPTYWQYMDLLIWWGGSAGEGIIMPPSGPVIDAAHQSGVKALGQVFFPPGAFGGQAAWVTQMLTVENGVYIYAKKLYEIAKYYGFDGWFINQETFAGDTSTQWEGFYDTYIACAAADGVVHELQWYDCGTSIGGRMNMIKKPGGSYFLNYGSPSTSNISSQMNSLTGQGFSKEQAMTKAYFGIEVAQGGYGPGNASYYKNLYPKAGHAGSIDLFCPEEKTWKDHVSSILNTPENNGTSAYDAMNTSFEHESRFWVNTKNDPSNAAEYDNNNFPGMSTGISERTFIQTKPFVTSFSAGLGKHRFVNGEKRGTQDWYHRGMQDVMPTWRWWIDCPSTAGVKDLKVDMNWDDAYNVGTSVVVSGKLTANTDNVMRLYKTNLSIATGDVFQLVFKGDVANLGLKLGVVEDANAFTDFPMTIIRTVNGWSVAEVNLSSLQGKTVSIIALNMKSTTDVSSYSLTLGQLAVLPAAYAPSVTQVANLTIQNQLTESGGDLRVVWDQVSSEMTNIHHYNVYLERNGVKKLVGQSKSEGFFIPRFERTSVAETSVKVYVAAVAKDMQEGIQIPLTVNFPALQAPVVLIKSMKTLLKVNEEVTLVARATNFPKTYTWSVVGGTLVSQEGNTAVFKFANEGTYNIAVTVANDQASTTETVNGLMEVSNTKELSNVGTGKTIHSRSGELAPELASWIIDGISNPGSVRDKWCIGGSKEHWAVIDLGSAHKLYRFKTFDCGVKENAADNIKSYKIFVSDDAQNWILALDERNRPETIKEDFIKPIVARYVKFVPYDTDVAITIRIWEFEIWGMEGNVSVSSIPNETMNMNTSKSFEVSYDLGGDPVDNNFAATVSAVSSDIVEISNMVVDQVAKKVKFDVNTKAAGKTDVLVNVINGIWKKESKFNVKSVDPANFNVALNKPVISYTVGTKWDEDGIVRTAIERVNDGDATNYWLSAYDKLGHQIVIDLGNNYMVNSSIIKLIDDGASNIPKQSTISYSLDNVTYTECVNFGDNMGLLNESVFVGSVVGRYFKLKYDPRSQYGIKLVEFELYGKLAGGTGVDNVTVSGVSVYPNPLSKGETLIVKTLDDAKTISVYTVQGLLVRSFPATGTMTQIDLGDMNSGIYLLKVVGNSVSTIKLQIK